MHTIRIHLWPKLESSAIKPIIETVMPMEAHDLVVSNQTFGKVLIAQAMAEDLILITNDDRIKRYDVRTLAAS